jgi:hypothetical protein
MPYAACLRIGHASCEWTDRNITLELTLCSSTGIASNAWATDAMSMLPSEPAAYAGVVSLGEFLAHVEVASVIL